MSGPFVGALTQLEGPATLWQSPPFAMPAAGSGHDFGLHVGSNRGWVAAYLKNVAADATAGFAPNDMAQYHPSFTQPVGTPGGSITMRLNPGRLTSKIAQGVYHVRRLGGGNITADGNASYNAVYRGIFSAGPGPYCPSISGHGPQGPILVGETREFSIPPGGTVDIPNPSPTEPFMWTLFGRCLVADGGCAPGDIMAFGTFKASGVVKGWGTSYSPANNRFSVGDNGAPQTPGKVGALFNPTNANWAFFFRFVGTPKGGLHGAILPMPKRHRVVPPRLWTSPPIPFKAGLQPVSFAMPDDFSPALVNAMYLCKAAEYGFGVGDWCPAHEGDNNASGGGFSATFRGRNVTLSPQTFDVQQFTHRLDTGAFAKLTDEYWSWFFVFVG